MAVALLLSLACAGALLSSVRTQVPPGHRSGVDLALEQLASHAGVHLHFRFLRSLDKSEMESGFGMRYLYHHFYLKPTTCAKGTADSSPQNCPFRNDRPLMDCAVCYKTVEDVMVTDPRPYVHCIQKPRLTTEMKAARTMHCKKMTYNSGAPTLLAVVNPGRASK